MKKIIALLVITFTIISFSSCKEDKEDSPSGTSYTNLSLKDARLYVGLDYNEVKTKLEAKGFVFDEQESSPDSYELVFKNSDNTINYSFGVNSETNIIYQAYVSKRSNIRSSSLNNYDFCQGECLAITRNHNEFLYAGLINSLFDDYESQSEFQNNYNSNMSTIGFCAEIWQSTDKAYAIAFMDINEEIYNGTETNTSSETLEYNHYYKFNVGYSDLTLKPATIEKISLKSILNKMNK